MSTEALESPQTIRQRIDDLRGRTGESLCTGGAGLSGSAASRALSDEYDQIVNLLWRKAEEEVPGAKDAELSLIATGGWGRREMCPYSDIDFIISVSKHER